MAYRLIKLETAGNIAIVTMNLPEKLNGTSAAMQQEMRHALDALQSDTAVRALILTGAGRAFCAGADLDNIRSQGTAKEQAEATYAGMKAQSNPLILDLQRSRLPVVAAVNGVAAGAGASIALACDIVLAARSAAFILPFAPKLGLVPDLGGSWLLPRLIGRARATGATLLGDKIGASQAEAWGLIWKAIDDAELASEARAVASQLASSPRHAALEVRKAFEVSERQGLMEQLEYEADRQRELIAREEFQEGLGAFVERRAPVFP